MRLYNKTLREIWNDVPVSYRIVVIASAGFIVFSLLYLTTQAFFAARHATSTGKGALEISGARAVNLLDPSLTSDGKTITALAYTGIEAETSPGASTLKISLALSDRPCNRWQWSEDLFSDRAETLLAPDGVTALAQGRVRYETPSIVFDATDPRAPWKVFAYRYFWMGNPGFAQRYSGIVMRSAEKVFGPWSKEQWVLAAEPDRPPPPYQQLVGNYITPLSPTLSGTTGYARPSVIAQGRVLLMSLVAFRDASTIDRVILLASLDHGKKWIFAGTLLSHDDLSKIGDFTRIAGASLVRQNDALYLATVLGDAAVEARGTYFFRIVDPAKGKLLSSANGTPTPIHHIERQSTQPTPRGGGFAAFETSCPAGVVTSEYSGIRNAYQLFTTQDLPSPAP